MINWNYLPKRESTFEMLRLLALYYKGLNMRIDTNSRALHEAGHNKRIEAFKINAIARNIANNEKMKKMELFYQNTVLLLSGFKTIKIA